MATIKGNSGNNNLIGNSARDILKGFGGNDTLNGNAGIDTLVGGTGNDIYIVDSTTDIIREHSGGGSRDTVRASVSYTLGDYLNDLTLTGISAISGGGNILNNTMTGNNADNSLNGGEGNDTLYGRGGNDFITGLNGNDTYYGGDGNDFLVDNASGFASNDNEFFGGNGNDFLDGSDGIDKLYGEDGDDTLSGREGNDILNGGPGSDWADYSNFGGTSKGVTVNLNTGTTSGLSGHDTLSSIENVLGSIGSDTLIGGAGNNILDGGPDDFGDGGNDSLIGGDGDDQLFGGKGRDTLRGGRGNDTLVGDFGKDTLTGDGGSDTFIFNYPEEGVDRITDFSSVTDTIQIKASSFDGGLQVGAITADQLYLGSMAQDPQDRFIYNNANGALFFDPTGSNNGATDQVQFATLVGAPGITANDIVVTA